MIRLRTGSRLHFGILSWNPDLPRQFGGVGVMIDEPGIVLTVEPARELRATGPLAERALAFARQLLAAAPPTPAPQAFHITIHRAPPEHVGLGTGTQLALALGHGILRATDQPDAPSPAWVARPEAAKGVARLAHMLGRGRRSAVGVHGFALGGFLVEAGKRPAEAISPLVARIPFPDHWRFVLVVPNGVRGLSGRDEEQAFRRLPPIPLTVTEHLCRVVLQGLLPAVAQADFPATSESLYEFNHRVGQCFAPSQGGPYASALSANIVDFLRSQACPGAGQSSWGPALFALAEDPDQAAHLRRKLQDRFSLTDDELVCTPARNSPAEHTPL